MNKTLNLNLYKLTQDELFKNLQIFLRNKNIKYDIIEEQIVSIRYPNKPIFVAHMDTVNDNDMCKNLFLNGNILKRKNGILGADDRAGVNIILNHCKDINFILTRDEEKGCLGIKKIVNEIEDYVSEYNNTCFIELDRKYGNSLLADVHGYCQTDLTDDILKIAPFLKNEIGAFTDIDYLIHIKPAVNLSVGYYNPHTNNEYLKIDEYLRINSLIPLLNKKLSNKTYELPNKDNLYDNIDCIVYDNEDLDIHDICDSCNEIMPISELYVTDTCETICIYCLLEKYNMSLEDIIEELDLIPYREWMNIK